MKSKTKTIIITATVTSVVLIAAWCSLRAAFMVTCPVCKEKQSDIHMFCCMCGSQLTEPEFLYVFPQDSTAVGQ